MKVLSGWKEIANHLHQGVRTVQRWELQHGLPIHRKTSNIKSPVLAFVEELEAWEKAKPMRTFDFIHDLKIKVEQLEAEVLALKRENRSIRLKLRKLGGAA